MSEWAIMNADALTYELLNTTHVCFDICYECVLPAGKCCEHCAGYEGDK